MAPNSVLPAELAEALQRLGAELERKSDLQGSLDETLSLLNRLPADAVVRAEREIVYAARLFSSRRRSTFIFSGPTTWSSELDQLRRFPDLRYLFILHGDGIVREAALRLIVSGLRSPFLFAAVAWRLNDWALPVRKAAAECAKRTFPLTAAPVIAQAALALLSREHNWGRWTDERVILSEAFGRSDVVQSLAELIKTKPTGAVASVLRYALQQEILDPYLNILSQDAAQPAVRALALQTLIDGAATWPRGFEMQWVDKSMGVKRRVRTFDRRALSCTHILPRRRLIVRSILDRSAAVRKVALDGLIRIGAKCRTRKKSPRLSFSIELLRSENGLNSFRDSF